MFGATGGIVDFACFDALDDLVLLRVGLDFREVVGLVLCEVDLALMAETEDLRLADFAAVATLARWGFSPSIDLSLFIVYNYNIMSIKLTKKQLAVLDFLRDFTDEKGYSPSYREIMVGLGLTSVSAVAEHVDNLVTKGVLRKVPGAARSLEILDYKHEETVALFKEKMLECTEEERKVLVAAAEIIGLDLE